MPGRMQQPADSAACMKTVNHAHALCHCRRRQKLATYHGNESKPAEDQVLADLGIAPSFAGGWHLLDRCAWA